MDISTILGIIIGFVLIVQAIGLGSIGNFIDPASILITVGGTVAAIIASFPLKTLATMGRHMAILFKGNAFKPEDVITKLVDLAQIARKDGLLALEEQSKDIKDPFFKRGILLVIDAMETEKVRSLLEEEIAAMDARHDAGAGIYERGGSVAPAFGMIGTLVGLINMLKGMDVTSGGGNLGKDMSVALVTTLYGCILAHMIFGPIANNLRTQDEEEVLCKMIIVEGITGIQAGENPKFLRERLLTFVSQKTRLLAEKSGGKGGGGDKE